MVTFAFGTDGINCMFVKTKLVLGSFKISERVFCFRGDSGFLSRAASGSSTSMKAR